MTTTERLLADAKEIWDSYHVHPFVKGIGDGTLDQEKFKYYMIQDYLYLIDYTKVFAVGCAKAMDMESMRKFAAYTNSIIHGEMDIHRTYMTRLGITEEEAEKAEAALDNISYTSYMIRIAYEGGAAEVAIAILSCALSYEVIAKRLVEENPGCENHPFYGEWISSYASEGYHDANVELIELTERLTKDCSEEQLAKLSEIFKNCSRYEASFWDMGWELRK